jgi:uncharacterized protein
MIQRQSIGEITKYLKHFPAVAILGPRQVGKTTLAKMIMSKVTKDTVYLDLELPSDLNKLSNAELYFDYNKDKCIIIDEIQRKLELFPLLRAVIDKNVKNGRFILLGSASPELLKRSSETLAGRIVYTELTPFNYYEIKDKYKYITHWLRGGFPRALLTKDDEIRNKWFNSFIVTYIERDLPLLGLKTSANNLNRFISMLAYNNGGLWNASTYAGSVGVSSPTISNYLDFLENSFIILRLQPYFHNIKKRLKKSPKIYFTDSGILHHLVGIDSFDKLLSNPIIGSSWEGYVIEQIISVTQNKFDYFYYRTQEGTECDLVLVKNQIPFASIEIKYSSSPSKTKSFTTAIKDLNTKNNYIIIPECDKPFPLSENIMVYGIDDFTKALINKTIFRSKS